MAVQNMYNNYLKRQQQTPTNQFRQKVANSLGGKSVGNNTTQKKSPAMMGNTSQNTLGSGVQNKPSNVSTGIITTPISKNPNSVPPISPTSVSTGDKQAITQQPVQNPLQSSITPLGGISSPEQIQPQDGQAGLGMISLEDINNYIRTDSNDTNQNSPLLSENNEQDESLNNPLIGRVASKNTTTKKNKTPQQLAQDALNEQKKQAQLEWEQQKKALELQREQLKESNAQSLKDADNAYKETESDLQENRYTQQEDLAVSGQKRGIQYSPQQLALENVANINLNKNLAEASKSRNELLNKLSIELNQALANVDMGLQNATVEYNKNVAGFMTTYQQQISDWAYNDQQTQADRDFQKEMADSQNKWQANENALDRKKYAKSSSGGSGYSYGRSYTPYSSNYSPYSTSQSYSDDLDLSTDEGSSAFIDTFKNRSTDLYNALSSDYYDPNERGEIYTNEIDKMIEYAKKNGAKSDDIKELEKTRDVATQHLYKKWYGQNTNQDYQLEDTVYKPNSVINKKHAEKTKKDAFVNASKYNSIVDRNPLTKGISKSNYLLRDVKPTKYKTVTLGSKSRDFMPTIKTNKPEKYTKTVKTPTTKAKKEKSKITTKTSISKKISTSKKNISTAKSKVQKTTNKKASQNNTKRTQTKFQKSFSNLKKNIGKLFGW